MAKGATRGSVHQSRATEVRSAEPVHEEEDAPWVRGSSLEMPPAQPGMDQRWIRVAMNGKDDATNWARKQREGWSPRKAETVPKDFAVPKIDQGKFSGYIGIEGMILCERKMSISKRRDKHFRDLTKLRTAAINHDLERVNADNRNPAFGPIRMATKTTPAREISRDVAVQED